MASRARIGVLALQGAFREHTRMLRGAGADVVEVRLPEQLGGLDGLVIPGGESTTILKLARNTRRAERVGFAALLAEGATGPSLTQETCVCASIHPELSRTVS